MSLVLRLHRWVSIRKERYSTISGSAQDEDFFILHPLSFILPDLYFSHAKRTLPCFDEILRGQPE